VKAVSSGQLPANGKGGVCIEQRLFSNSTSNLGREGSARLLSLAGPDIGRAVKRRTCWPTREVSANLTTMTHFHLAIAHRDGPCR
jgi:hypothetical protein